MSPLSATPIPQEPAAWPREIRQRVAVHQSIMDLAHHQVELKRTSALSPRSPNPGRGPWPA